MGFSNLGWITSNILSFFSNSFLVFWIFEIYSKRVCSCMWNCDAFRLEYPSCFSKYCFCCGLAKLDRNSLRLTIVFNLIKTVFWIKRIEISFRRIHLSWNNTRFIFLFVEIWFACIVSTFKHSSLELVFYNTSKSLTNLQHHYYFI